MLQNDVDSTPSYENPKLAASFGDEGTGLESVQAAVRPERKPFSVNVLPVLSSSREIDISISAADGPDTSVDASVREYVQDLWGTLSTRTNNISIQVGEIIRAHVDGQMTAFGFFQVGAFFASYRPSQAMYLNGKYIGDMALVHAAGIPPLSDRDKVTRLGNPHLTTIEAIAHNRGYMDAVPAVIGHQDNDQLFVAREMVRRLTPIDLVCIGFQCGLWFPQHSVNWPLDDGRFLRVTDFGGLVGTIHNPSEARREPKLIIPD